MKTIGRSLPCLVLAPIASLAMGHHVSVSSDRAETRPGLLTGGLLVRVQPEEPPHKNRRKLNTAGRLRVLSFCTPLTGDFGDRRVSNA